MLIGGDICKRVRLAAASQEEPAEASWGSPCPPVTPAQQQHIDALKGTCAVLPLPAPSAVAASPVQQEPEYHKDELAWYYGLPAGRVLAKVSGAAPSRTMKARCHENALLRRHAGDGPQQGSS